MAFEKKIFDLNGIDLIPYTHLIDDDSNPESSSLSNLGEETKQQAENNLGVRMITWEGYVSNEDTLFNLRKAVFNPDPKILKISQDKELTVSAINFQKIINIKKPDESKMTMTLMAADAKEYSSEATIQIETISEQGQVEEIKSLGTAPTTPAWTITAPDSGTVENFIISNGTDSIEIYESISDGEYLEIDADGQVSKNGIELDSIGGDVLKIEPGVNEFTFSTADAENLTVYTIQVEFKDAFY